MKGFAYFFLISGIGWIIDITVFECLIKLLYTPVFLSNFISSYAALTFVWLRFLRTKKRNPLSVHFYFLLIYWSYHFISIVFYSLIIDLIENSLELNSLIIENKAVYSKLIMTPFNLLTNFIFIKLLLKKLKNVKK